MYIQIRPYWAKGLAAVAAALLLPTTVLAVGTTAGTEIQNTATVSYSSPSGTTLVQESNNNVVVVDEIIDVTIVSNDPSNVPATSPDTDVPLSFTVTNTGNGVEPYQLTVNSALPNDQFDPSEVSLFLDADGDDRFNPAVDTPYTFGVNDPLLDPDESITVFAVSDIQSDLLDQDIGLVELTATAATGSGPAGTVFDGQGANGTDAVIGVTTATAEATNGYIISQVASSLNKTARVEDQFGGSNAVPGATITYTLVFDVSGSGSLTDAVITDQVPANTTYVPDSITVDGVSVSDAVGDDLGEFNANTVTANLGSITAPAQTTISFQVTID